MTAIEMNTQIKTSMRLEAACPIDVVIVAAAPHLVAQCDHSQGEYSEDVHKQDEHNQDDYNLDEHMN